MLQLIATTSFVIYTFSIAFAIFFFIQKKYNEATTYIVIALILFLIIIQCITLKGVKL